MPVRAGLQCYIDYSLEYAGYHSYRSSIRAIKPGIGKVKNKGLCFSTGRTYSYSSYINSH